jgi:hypothetical protein
VLRARLHAEVIARDRVSSSCMTAIGFTHGLISEMLLRIRRR